MTKNNQAILADTSLCAIIRDEIMNPAGGIERFIHSIVPHVEQAVILDTGSIDGTREKLEELQTKYPQMKVYDRKFDNYVNSRNHSLKRVKTKRALVLDADELITMEGFTKIAEHLDNPPNAYNGGFNFTFKGVYAKQIKIEDNVHNPRLFEISKNLKYISDYNDGSFETLRCLINFYHPELRCSWGYAEDRPGFISLPKSVPIFHFHSPNSQETDLKKERWYNHPEIWKKGPSKVIGFKEWKAFNPRRDEYR